MQLCLGKVSNEGPDKHSGFSLSDEWGCRSDNCFGARNAHAPEEEDGEFLNEPLENAPVVQKLDEGDEENDGRNHTGKEPSQLWNTRIG